MRYVRGAGFRARVCGTSYEHGALRDRRRQSPAVPTTETPRQVYHNLRWVVAEGRASWRGRAFGYFFLFSRVAFGYGLRVLLGGVRVRAGVLSNNDE